MIINRKNNLLALDFSIKKLEETLPDSFTPKKDFIFYLKQIRNNIAHKDCNTSILEEANILLELIADFLDKENHSSYDDLLPIVARAKFIIEAMNSLNNSYNTEQYYQTEIKKQKGIIDKYSKQLEELKKDSEDKIKLEQDLENAKQMLKKYENELENNKKRDDAINNWNNKISLAFKGLEEPIDRLNDEHKRLIWLYNVYKWSSIGLVIFLIVIEIVVYLKIIYSKNYPTWEQYLPMVLPVPVTLGLLWGFITQMNRAQRQMLVISNKIHEIKYTEGLLQSLNTLSVDISESMSKINDAISHLIDNHLHNMDTMRINETDLSKIEKQNALPIEQIPELIKLINKSKE